MGTNAVKDLQLEFSEGQVVRGRDIRLVGILKYIPLRENIHVRYLHIWKESH